MSAQHHLDPDEIPPPSIAHKDGNTVTLRCRTPEEACLVFDELQEEDALAILTDEEALPEQFDRCGHVDHKVSTKASDSLSSLRSDEPLSVSGKVTGLPMGLMIVPGILVFGWLLASHRKQGFTRKARHLKFWFFVGFAIWILLVIPIG